MSKKLQLLLSLFAVILCLPVIGQDFSQEFGKVGRAEFELKQYAPDKEAEAVVLFDIGKTKFEESQNAFDVIFERESRIKILSQEGVDYAEIQIPYYQEGSIYEQVYDVEAYSYNIEDGRLVEAVLDISNIFDERINKYWKMKKFAVPNAKSGSIIEYKYKIKSPEVFNLRDWRFQWKIPVVHSKYEIRMIPFYSYAFILQGANKFDSYTVKQHREKRSYLGLAFQDNIHTYIINEVPAFKSEDFITSINDFIIKLDFQLSEVNYPSGGTKEVMTTWEKMNADLLNEKNFGRYINRSERQARRLFDIDDVKRMPEKERFNFVLDFVKSNYNWNKRNGKFATKTTNDFVSDKFGNSADVNLFTIGLLNAVDLKAKPVLISTRQNGKIKFNYPLLSYFNYVTIIVDVDGEKINTDATEILSLNDRIPTRCFNDKGLIVDNEKVEWVNLEFPILSETQDEIRIEIADNEFMKTSISKTATEYDALFYRNNYGNNLETIKGNLDNKNFTIIDSTINIQNQYNREKPYTLTYSKTSKPEIIQDKIYISPFLDKVISDNPLKQDVRTYPVDMVYPRKRGFTTTIIIPEDYEVEYIPKDREIKNQLFELSYLIEQKEEEIAISFHYTFNNAIYFPNNYLHIKAFFDEIVEHGNEKIVLSKKI